MRVLILPIEIETPNNGELIQMANRVADKAEIEQSREMAVMPSAEGGALAMASKQEVQQRFRRIQETINDVLKEGVDYGIVPGTSRKDAQGNEMAKPSLFKSGAEKIATLFLLDAEFDNVLTYDGDHLNVMSTCTLYHIPTGHRVGSGSSICSTRESKYAYRLANLKCPGCGAEALIHTKRSPTDWWCSSYKGGCGANFPGDDPKITGQERGQVANDKLPDQYNTVIKMAEKRAKVGAIIGATGASEFVTQDLEDLAENGVIPGAETGSGASQTKNAGTTSSEHQKTAQKGSNASKKGAVAAKNGAKEPEPTAVATGLSEDDVREMNLTCEILDSDPGEIMDFYKSLSPDAKNRIKSFADFSPAEFKHFQKSAEAQAGNQKKDLKALLIAAKEKAAAAGADNAS